MGKSISVNANKRGRPVTTGTGTVVGVRMLDRTLAALDAWIAKQKDPELSRPRGHPPPGRDRAEGEGQMTIADVWTAIYPWIVAGLGGFVGAALLLPTKL